MTFESGVFTLDSVLFAHKKISESKDIYSISGYSMRFDKSL